MDELMRRVAVPHLLLLLLLLQLPLLQPSNAGHRLHSPEAGSSLKVLALILGLYGQIQRVVI